MKEATGELNITVITIVAIAAVAALFYAFVWPNLKISLAKSSCENGGGTYDVARKCCNYGNGQCVGEETTAKK